MNVLTSFAVSEIFFPLLNRDSLSPLSSSWCVLKKYNPTWVLSIALELEE